MSNNQKNHWITLATVLGAIAALITAITPFIKPESEQPVTSEPVPTQKVEVSSVPVSGVRFFCGTGEYQGRSIPATIVENPQSNEEIIVILWKLDNDFFGENYPPEQRCKMVS